jgi:hypothetical protein
MYSDGVSSDVYTRCSISTSQFLELIIYFQCSELSIPFQDALHSDKVPYYRACKFAEDHARIF